MSVQQYRENKLLGIYRGKVVKHLENGIVKVYIPDIYPLEWASSPDKLPDAEIAMPVLGGNCNGNGTFSYPNIGAFVICQFLNGDQNLPIVIGTTQGGSLASMKWHEVADELDPSTGKEPSCVHMLSVGRSKLKMYEGGQIELTVVGGSGKSAQIIVDKDGNVLFNCDGNFQVIAENVKMMAKNQIAMFAGKNVIVSGRNQVTLCGNDIASLAPQGTVTFHSKHKLTGV